MIQKPARAMLARMDTGEVIEFINNPHVLEDEKSAEYDMPEVNGAIAPPLQFKYGGARTIRFEVRYIAQGNVDQIARQIEFVRNLAIPVKPKNVPPLARLSIGGFQVPIRITRWRVPYSDWTPALRPKDVTLEVEAVVDYGTQAPAQPKPASVNKAKGKQAVKKNATKVQKIKVKKGTQTGFGDFRALM